MDGGIGEEVRIMNGTFKMSLNPCFDGWWYRRFIYDGLLKFNLKEVLILVLMDGGIKANPRESISWIGCSLNPCFDGWWYRRNGATQVKGVTVKKS